MKNMAATHVHPGAPGRWVQVETRPETERVPKRAKRPQQWTRLFFHGEPKPWHRGMAALGLVTVGFYLFWIVILPFLIV